jgi:predicted RNase H-like HicB family nuclease
MRHDIVITQTANGYAAHVPTIPGVIAAAETREETEQLIEEAIALHLEALAARGCLIVDAPLELRGTVPLWSTLNSISMHVTIEAPPLSIAAIALPQVGFGSRATA